MGKVFPAPQSRLGTYSPGSANCPECQRPSNKRVCPVCHYELHPDVGTTDERMIAVIGGRGTGKSSYIATLVQRLRNEVSMNFDAGVITRGDRTRDRYEDDFYTPLFRDKRVLPATTTGATDPRTKTPMVYRIKFNRVRNQVVTLVLFDTAGEDMRSLDSMSTEARYITNSQGLIFLFDPLQIPSVREQLHLKPTDEPRLDHEAEPIKIIERLYELYEANPRWRNKEMIQIPIAFTLSKIDALYPIIDPGSALHRSGDHLGYLNKADLETVHSEISAYLDEWMGKEFEQLVRTHFRDYHFFGVAPLGTTPTNGKIQTVSPLRVEDPLLWLFSKYKVIKER